MSPRSLARVFVGRWLFDNQLSSDLPATLCGLSQLSSCAVQNQSASYPACTHSNCGVVQTACHVPLCAVSLKCAPANDYTTCSVLSDLYMRLAGLSWTTQFGWSAARSGTATDYCTFAGVLCDESGNVTTIDLSGHALSGTLPESLSKLSTLSRLDLSSNAVNGTLPDALCELRSIQYLSLYDNSLSGTLPACLSNLTTLTFLAMSNNFLSGVITSSFCKLQPQLYSGRVACILGVLPHETNTFTCPLPCGDTAFMSVCGVSSCTAPTPPMPMASFAAHDKHDKLALGLGIGLGMGIFLVSACAAGLLLRRRRLATDPSRPSSADWSRGLELHAAVPLRFDVFLSYRLQDHRLADAIVDKLTLAGLNVFIDKGGVMSGRPLMSELFIAMRSSAVVIPLITMDTMASFSDDARTDHTEIDFILAEYIIALHLLQTGDVRMVYPILVGEEVTNAQGRAEWSELRKMPQYRKLSDVVPDVPPHATIAAVNYVLAMHGAFAKDNKLPSTTQTVRDIVLGRYPSKEGDMGATGILTMSSFNMACPLEDLGLYVQNRVVNNIRRVLPNYVAMPMACTLRNSGVSITTKHTA